MHPPRFPRIVLLGSALAAFGCASLPEKQPIAAEPIQLEADEWRVADQVVVITDASGTMYVNQTFPEAKALTRSFISAMPAADAPSASERGYEAAVIGFGGDDRTESGLVPFQRSRLASTASEIEIMGDVSGLGGETPLHAVIAESRAALAGKSGRAALVIFSDGLPDDSALTLFEARKLVRARQGNVCIHTVQTGTDPEGAAFLDQLSQLTGCGSARNAAELDSNFEVQQLARTVFVGPADLPPVAAPGPCEGVVRLRGIEFGFDRAEIREDSKPVLDVAVQRLNQCPEIRVTITGHTDAIGTEEYNEDLSLRRAEATRSYLVQQGVEPSRLRARGEGESDPIAPNDSPEGRRRNRRVELSPTR